MAEGTRTHPCPLLPLPPGSLTHARSGGSDQIFASIVSVLLALMDGLTDRGQVLVIGATNRSGTQHRPLIPACLLVWLSVHRAASMCLWCNVWGGIWGDGRAGTQGWYREDR